MPSKAATKRFTPASKIKFENISDLVNAEPWIPETTVTTIIAILPANRPPQAAPTPEENVPNLPFNSRNVR
jgi:hypothetical protein